MAFAKRSLRGLLSLQGIDDSPSMDLYVSKGHDHHHRSLILEEGGNSEALGFHHFPTPLMEPSSSSSSCLSFGASAYFHTAAETHEPIRSLKSSSTSSVFNFEQAEDRVVQMNYQKDNQNEDEDQCCGWIDAMDQNYQLNCSPQDQNRFGLLYSSAASVVDRLQGTPCMDRASQKRPFIDEMQPTRSKSTANGTKKAKNKTTSSKDPQSIAAKNRRERISERLKTLQELVPNGTKVDLVTMLEKAISYVKFLQLQVKVLATDEFWPSQGGKAPEIGQVKEAIDAILSSCREKNS